MIDLFELIKYALFYASLDIVLVIATVLLFYISFILVFEAVNALTLTETSQFITEKGWFTHRILITTLIYYILTIPTFFAILVIVPAPSDLSNAILRFAVLASFLVSLRLLVNTIGLLYENAYQMRVNYPSPKDEEKIQEIGEKMREWASSFYFAWIEGGIFICIIELWSGSLNNNVSKAIEVMINPIENLYVLLIAYLIAVFLLTLWSEMVLDMIRGAKTE